jgi:SAM-dependent methyltransferase
MQVEKVDFDKYAGDYDAILKDQLKFFSGDDKYFASYKVRLVRRYSVREPKTILEYGCGTGRNLPFFKEKFPAAEIFGADISAQSIAIAKAQNPFAHCAHLDDAFVQSAGKFDMIFVAGVFHHITPNERAAVLRQIQGLLTAGGSVFVFEHNPYNPLTQKLVRECPFDADASLISMPQMRALMEDAGFVATVRRYTLFVPPALRGLIHLENYLGWLPLGGQYFIRAEKNT